MKDIDSMIYSAVFEDDEGKKKDLLRKIIMEAEASGIVPASIKPLYLKMAEYYPGFTVPAINIRGLTYDVARAVFRKAMELNVGAFIFEIARSEIGYTRQRPLEYTAVILSAGLREGYRGYVFIQGDHFQVVKKNYEKNPEGEIDYLRGLIKEAIDARFYNIDIDTSTLVDITKDSVYEQQRPNFEMTAEVVRFIKSIDKDISIGGEIGEIGKHNSTPEELRAYMDGLQSITGKDSITKISVQTGTTHGGVVLPDGRLAQVKVDFETLRILSGIARRKYKLAGAVQHGASTLPEEAFHMFPEAETAEIHLATGFQNIIYNSKHLPFDFRNEVYEYIKKEFISEKKEEETEEQFIYRTRKKGFGALKKRWWDLPQSVKNNIMKELEDRFELLFKKLKVVNTKEIVDKILDEK